MTKQKSTGKQNRKKRSPKAKRAAPIKIERSSTRPGSEFFCVDKDGKKQDAALHEDILNVDKGTEARVRNIGKEIAREIGLSEAAVAKLYSEE